MVKRVVMCTAGIIICSLSVSFFKRAMMGVDPFQTLLAGFDCVVPLSFGTCSLILNAVFLLFGVFTDRHYIGLGTLLMLFLSGYIIDFATNIIFGLLPEAGLFARILCLIIGIVIMCLAASIYTTADLGVSAYDQVALILAHTYKLGQFRFIRIGTDLICVTGGVILYLISGGQLSGLGSLIGAGTICAAFFMGPLIDFFIRHLAEPLLYGKEGKHA